MTEKSKQIGEDQPVTAYKYGNSLEMSNVIGADPIVKKYDRDHMINIKTGEILDITHVESRADPKNRESLRHTFKRLKRLIGANFYGGRSELWVTLTYKWQEFDNGEKIPMTNPDKLFIDFRLFMRKLKRRVKKYIAYIAVVEPQGSGAFHLHVMMKTLDGSTLYIKNKDLAQCWGQGFVNVRRLKSSDNVSAYLMAYLTDIDINNPDGKFDNSKSKSIIKGGRLGMYPMHFQIYRRSRKGIKDPKKLKGNCGKIKRKFNVTEPDYYRTFDIDRGGTTIAVETEYYDLKKQKLKQALEKIKRK